MPSKSKAQQRFMGMVHAAQKGEKPASAKVAKVAKSINKDFTYKTIGVRPGEKIHEELISKADSHHAYDLKYCYSIVDYGHAHILKYYKRKKFNKVKKDFEYNSCNNEKYLSISELKKLVDIYKKIHKID